LLFFPPLLAGFISFYENRLKLPAIAYAFVFSFNIPDRAHQGFGWVGEWANTRLAVNLEYSLIIY